MDKAQNLRDPNSCLNKALDGEPVFILRAKDPVAAMAVRHWATMSVGVHEPEKVKRAIAEADAMDQWRQDYERSQPLYDEQAS